METAEKGLINTKVRVAQQGKWAYGTIVDQVLYGNYTFYIVDIGSCYTTVYANNYDVPITSLGFAKLTPTTETYNND